MPSNVSFFTKNISVSLYLLSQLLKTDILDIAKTFNCTVKYEKPISGIDPLFGDWKICIQGSTEKETIDCLKVIETLCRHICKYSSNDHIQNTPCLERLI
jgi:hypothetical protein